MKIAENTYVAMEYRLSLDSGEELDRSPEGEALGFIVGADMVIPGLEKGLLGYKVGDTPTVTIEAEDGYGPTDPDLIQEVPREQFPDDVEPEAGMVFETESSHGEALISVVAVNDDFVTVDLNHPLAGKRLVFEVKIVEVRSPSAEELAELAADEEEAADGCGCGCASPSKEERKPKGGCGSGCGCGSN